MMLLIRISFSMKFYSILMEYTLISTNNIIDLAHLFNRLKIYQKLNSLWKVIDSSNQDSWQTLNGMAIEK